MFLIFFSPTPLKLLQLAHNYLVEIHAIVERQREFQEDTKENRV